MSNHDTGWEKLDGIPIQAEDQRLEDLAFYAQKKWLTEGDGEACANKIDFANKLLEWGRHKKDQHITAHANKLLEEIYGPPFVIPTLNQITDLLRKEPHIRFAGKIYQAWLVGSFAAGTTSRSSDVDILVRIGVRAGYPTGEAFTKSIYDRLVDFVNRNGLRYEEYERHIPHWCGRRLKVFFTYDRPIAGKPAIELQKEVQTYDHR